MRAQDGHELDSRWEALVDDALAANSLTHSIHPPYPGTHMHADFLVGDVYVEVWGWKSESYLERRHHKEKLAQQTGLKLVGIDEEDLKKAKRLAAKVEHVRRLMRIEQHRISEDKTQRTPRPSTIDLWTTAELLAHAHAALDEVDRKLGHIGHAKLDLAEKLARLESEEAGLQKTRADIIGKYIS